MTELTEEDKETFEKSDAIYDAGYSTGYEHAKRDGFIPSLLVGIISAMIAFVAGTLI